MPASLIFIRCFLGLLCVAFAHILGHSAYRKYKLHARDSNFTRWALRTIVTGLGAIWHGGLDALSLSVLGLSIASGATGFYRERHPPEPEEDLSKVIFPHDEEDK